MALVFFRKRRHARTYEVRVEAAQTALMESVAAVRETTALVHKSGRMLAHIKSKVVL